jgi:hypothetical protein
MTPSTASYQQQPSYPIPQQYPSSQMIPAAAPYQQQQAYPIPQQYPSSTITAADSDDTGTKLCVLI